MCFLDHVAVLFFMIRTLWEAQETALLLFYLNSRVVSKFLLLEGSCLPSLWL